MKPPDTHVVLVHDVLVVGSGVLVLLVLGNQILQVGLGLSELAAISFAESVPEI
jgi:hypothetical protein